MMSGNLPLKSRLKIMSVLLYVIWVLVFPQFRNIYVMCLVLPVLKNVLLICTWWILLLKSLWEELIMLLFLQIGTMSHRFLLFLILIAIYLVELYLVDRFYVLLVPCLI